MLSIKRLKTAQLSGDYLQLQDQDQTVTGCLQPLAQFSLLCRLRHGLFSVARCLGNVYNFSAVIMAKNCFRSDDFFFKGKASSRMIWNSMFLVWSNAFKCYWEQAFFSARAEGYIWNPNIRLKHNKCFEMLLRTQAFFSARAGSYI